MGHARWNHATTAGVANRVGARNLHRPENFRASLGARTRKLGVVRPKRLRPVVQRARINAEVLPVQLTK
jgi:hypothetical protein